MGCKIWNRKFAEIATWAATLDVCVTHPVYLRKSFAQNCSVVVVILDEQPTQNTKLVN